MSAGDTESPSPEPEGSATSGIGAGSNGATSTASITELELEFAQNPQGTAFIPLCEAYMEQNRFMEAMVVAKRGMKAHPESVEAKVLLADVYARQKKYKRALTELDNLVDKHSDNAKAHFARGKVRLDSGNETGAIEDLKRALDLDASIAEASALLAEKGIIYPEPPPEPDPPPAPPPLQAAVSVTPAVSVAPGSHAGVGVSVTGVAPASSAPPMPAGANIAVPAPSLSPAVSGVPSLPPRGASVRQVLEGEDELEKLAQEVANEKPAQGGRPLTTFALIGVLLLVGIGTLSWRFYQKSKIESIDRLTTQATPLLNRDTYGSYKEAVLHLEEIIEDHDKNHPLTLGRLALAYAILWGEHGEGGLKPRLDEILKRALEKAPDVSHTVAAHGLSILYEGKDRQASASKALTVVEPMVRRAQEGGAAPTQADLALGIIETELGEYDAATKRLNRVKEVLPGSVRAKVRHAQGAFRSGRLGVARAGYEAALRTEDKHPSARASLALTRLRLGDLDGARKDLEQFDKVSRENEKDISRRDSALAEFARSELLRSDGKEAQATGAYETALRYDPENADFPFGLGRWLLQNAGPQAALEPLRKAVEMDPNRWAFLVELAEAEMFNRRFDAASELIEKALKKAPDQVEVHLSKARLLRRRKDRSAEDFIKGLLKKWPSRTVDIHLELGRFYRSQDRFRPAREALETAIDGMGNYPVAKQAKVLLSYGRLMEDTNDPLVALRSYKTAAEYGELEGYYRMAVSLVRSGQRSEAKPALRRYLAAGTSLRYSKSARDLLDSL